MGLRGPEIASMSARAPLIPSALDSLLKLRGRRPEVALVSCGKAKRDDAFDAADLYKSPLFNLSQQVARYISPKYFIISAKHGLLEPQSKVSPYELSLKSLSASARVAWGKAVMGALADGGALKTPLLVFGGSFYAEALKAGSDGNSIEFIDPLEGLSLGKRMAVLSKTLRIIKRIELVKQLYDALGVAEKNGNLLPLRCYLDQKRIPDRGLYIFVDPDEGSIFDATKRVVRIGTHGVSVGSRSTLRSRLRTHSGPKSLIGSHRSSVFRLHIGTALAAGRPRITNSQWGIGSIAPPHVRAAESQMEIAVSEYINRLKVSIIPIGDEPGPESSRARIERALIGLLTEDNDLIDCFGDSWLGRQSDRPQISDTGLWNIQHIGSRADLKAVALAINLLQSYMPFDRKPLSSIDPNG